MTDDEEIEKEAKKYSQGNFYYEQGFAKGRKETCEKLLEAVRVHDDMEQISVKSLRA